jgi:serine/threonine protein phosphatase PrpC
MHSVYGSSTVGDRDHQEDDFSFALAKEHRSDSDVLMILCDGMGGHVGGEVASSTAVKAFQNSFETDPSTDPQKRLANALTAANTAIGDKISENSQFEGMGSTLVGAIKLPNRLFWVSVGDSHIYLFRAGNLTKLNADHSLFSELLEKVRKGEITMEQARSNPRKNALMSAVMGRNIALVDLNQIILKDGDMIVLASDGLDTLTDDQFKSIVESKYGAPPEEVTEALLSAVRSVRKPRQDNTTVVVCYHTTKSFPFWKEATHWADIEKNLSVSSNKKPLLIGVLALLIVSLVAAFSVFFLEVPKEKPMASPLSTVTPTIPPPLPIEERPSQKKSSIGEIKVEPNALIPPEPATKEQSVEQAPEEANSPAQKVPTDEPTEPVVTPDVESQAEKDAPADAASKPLP